MEMARSSGESTRWRLRVALAPPRQCATGQSAEPRAENGTFCRGLNTESELGVFSVLLPLQLYLKARVGRLVFFGFMFPERY